MVSNFVSLSHLPKGVMRGSSYVETLPPRSALSYIVRILYIMNGLPCRPILSCLKTNAPPGIAILWIMKSIRMTGNNNIMAVRATILSKMYFANILFASCAFLISPWR